MVHWAAGSSGWPGGSVGKRESARLATAAVSDLQLDQSKSPSQSGTQRLAVIDFY